MIIILTYFVMLEVQHLSVNYRGIRAVLECGDDGANESTGLVAFVLQHGS
ncbi:MAG: hypothetical protein AAGA75_11855 [Cyanobacteria bacterium P01_E01_bin.6]